MWKTLSSKEIFNHPRVTLVEDEILLPDGNKINYLMFKTTGGGAVTIIAKRDDGKILIQKEYSYPVDKKIFQFPGGGIALNEEPAIGANRELMEEMGYRANELKFLGEYLMNNRRSTEKMFVFLASDLVEESLEKDLEEDIESFWFDENEIDAKVKNGEIINVHSLASWSLYKSR